MRALLRWGLGTLVALCGVCASTAMAEEPRYRWSAFDYRGAQWHPLEGRFIQDHTRTATDWVQTSGADGRVIETRPVLAAPATAAVLRRVLDVSTSTMAASGQRVAALECNETEWPKALWLLSGTARTRLPLPQLEETSPQDAIPWFRRTDGALMLWARFHPCCDYYLTANFRWSGGRWVRTPGDEPPTKAQIPLPPNLPAAPEADQRDVLAMDGSGRPWSAGNKGVFVFAQDTWWRVAGAPTSAHSVLTDSTGEVWISSKLGLHRGKTKPLAPLPASHPLNRETPLPPTSPLSAPLVLREGPPLEATVEKVDFPVPGSDKLSSATSVVTGESQSLLFVSGQRVVSLRSGHAQLAAKLSKTPSAPAVTPQGTWLVEGNQLVHIRSPSRTALTNLTDLLPEPSAIAMGAGQTWVVSCRPGDPLPAAIRRDTAQWRWAPEIPDACYRAAKTTPAGDAWFAGGLGLSSDGYGRDWPVGDGIVVHAHSGGVRGWRVPQGPLVAVAPMGEGEAWAAGYDGLLAHFAQDTPKVYQLAGAPWILGLHAHNGELWLVGEGLIGRVKDGELRRLAPQTLPLGTWRGITVDHEGNIWAVGKPAILRIRLSHPVSSTHAL